MCTFYKCLIFATWCDLATSSLMTSVTGLVLVIIHPRFISLTLQLLIVDHAQLSINKFTVAFCKLVDIQPEQLFASTLRQVTGS